MKKSRLRIAHWLVILLSFAAIISFADSGLSGLSFGGPKDGAIPPADQAFHTALALKKNRLIIRIQPAKNVYIYRKSITVVAHEPTQLMLDSLPPGHLKNDPNFGPTEIYTHPVRVAATIQNAQQGPLIIDLSLQGCSSLGICYPPQKYTRTINNPTAITTHKTAATTPVVGEEHDQFFQKLSSHSLSTLLLFLGLGCLLAFTPCLFPMIPIISSVIIGHGTTSRFHAFLLSLAYTAGVCFTYTTAGILSAMSGTLLASGLQSPLALSLFFIIIVGFALSMFGLFNIQLPSAIMTKMTVWEQNQKRKGFTHALIMGIISALMLGPCVTPPLAGTLLYIAETGDVWFGGTALFMMGLGISIPLIISGISANALLPRAGAWMDQIKMLCGFLLLALAVHMITSLISPFATTLSYIVILMATSVWSGLFDVGTRAPLRLIGLLCFLFGLALGVPLVINTNNNTFLAKSNQQETQTRKVQSLTELKKIIRERKKPLLIEVTAEWCSTCRQLDRETLHDPRVIQKLNHFDVIVVDMTQSTPQNKEIMHEYQLFGPPALILYQAHSHEHPTKLIGFQSAETLLQELTRHES